MLKVNAKRLLSDFESLSQIGRTEDGGVHRPALSQADLETRRWFKERAQAAGLEFRQDGAGNASALLRCKRPDAKTLLAGSHLDSVPHGGRFDGPLGVLATLESARAIQEAGLDLPVHLEVISFTDEEGTWLGLLGSRAFAGLLSRDDLQRAKGGAGAFEEVLKEADLQAQGILNARRDPRQHVGFIEVHIEQGRRLEAARVDIGVVTEIVGIRWQWLRFLGAAAHAGTQPMDQRKDALWGAARFVEQARAIVKHHDPGVVNCGQIETKPGAFNIVPAEVKLALEFRHSKPEALDAMEADLFGLAWRVAAELGLQLHIEPVAQVPPAGLHPTVVGCIEQAADALGLKHTRLMSFAGHDTQSLSAIMPSAMFFVPSVDGVSHNPKEFTRDEDLVNAANVMLHALIGLARTMT